jgi:hypothetical protein
VTRSVGDVGDDQADGRVGLSLPERLTVQAVPAVADAVRGPEDLPGGLRVDPSGLAYARDTVEADKRAARATS